jgi:diguanylate cyclase (GGDEF)-like protein
MTILTGFPVQERPWYKAALREQHLGWTKPFQIGIEPVLTVNAFAPLFDEQNNLQGIFSVNLSLTNLQQFLQTLEVCPGCQIVVTDPEGQLIANSVDEIPFKMPDRTTPDGFYTGEFKRLHPTESQSPTIAAAAAHWQTLNLHNHAMTRSQFHLNGETYWLRIASLETTLVHPDWTIAVIVPQSVFLKAITANLYRTLLLCILALVASILISSVVAQMIIRPLVRLQQSANAIASGTLDVDSPIKGFGTVHKLSLAFNQMRENLKSHREHLEELVAKRTAELHIANKQLTNQAYHLEELVSLRTAELHALNDQLQHQAYHDALTGLPNRALFNDRLTQAILHAQRNSQVLAVLFLDLDRFKTINDTLGHVVGDQLLRFVAVRLGEVVRKNDTVARLGGDEFTILLSPISCVQDAGDISQKLIHSLEHPFNCYGRELHLTTSIGIAAYPDDGIDNETLMKNADTAMYCAKAQGRNKYRFFVADMYTTSLTLLEMEHSLRSALLREEFVVYFQPQCHVRSRQITAVEALVRWRHEEMGLVPPAEFIPILEETGLIVQVGEWVLRNACAQAKAWNDVGIAPVMVAVNFSSQQFNQKKLGDTVKQILDEIGFPPEYLTIEITESVLMKNTEETIRTLHDLSTMGIHLAIDDFGTGYSSLSYLKRFPIDAIKIDKSFVRDIAADADDAAIVKAIIAMAHALSLKVIAEGVETEDQLAFLRGSRCDAVQGYLFHRPLSQEELISRFTTVDQELRQTH